MKNNIILQSRAERIAWVDGLCGIAILLVVLGHVNPPFKKIIYGFHMALFFIISGFLFKDCYDKKLSQWIKAYFQRYIVPYFILCGVNFLIEALISICFRAGMFPFNKYLCGILYSYGSTEWMPNCSPLWFLTCLFCASCMLRSIHLITQSNSKRIIICLVLSGISYILDVLDVPRLPWNFGTAMMAVLFIEIGFQINKMDILNKLKYQGCGVQIFVCIIILFSATIGIILNPVEIVEFSANNYGSFILMIMGSVSASFLLMFFANIVGSSTASAKALTYLGRHTLFLMSFDYFSDFISVRVLQIFRVHNWLFSFCGKVLVLVIGLQLLQLAIKVIPNESAKKFLSKY